MQLFLCYEFKKKLSFYFLNYIMAAKTSSPELSFGDWEGEDVDELLKQHKLDLIAVVRLCYILNPLEDGFPMSYKKIMHF